MNLRLCVALTTACFLFQFLTPAKASAGPGTNAVKNANQSLERLLRKKAAPNSKAEARLANQVTKELQQFLDIEELGKRAMQDQWSKLNKAQRTEFTKLLRTLIEKNYVKGLRSNLNYKVVYTGEKPSGKGLLVTTEIQAKRRNRPYTISIDYVLHKHGTSWRAFDVITDGVGLVANYRAQFNKIIDKEGISGLLSRMRKKLAST